jgi:steroid delta-isomerase-like uncharacterized protein
MAGSSSNDQKIELVLAELLDAWNVHNIERVASFYSPNYVGIDVSESGQQRGPEGVRHTIQRYLQAFPDLQLVQEEKVLEVNRAAVKVTAHGTHQGGIMNIPATGRSTEVRGVAFLTFEDGKITKASYVWDVAGFLRSIGLLPEL